MPKCTDVTDTCACSGCGKLLPEELTPRTPCPVCGGTARTSSADIREELQVREYLKVRHRSPGTNDFDREVTEGDDYTRSAGRWDRICQVVDRLNNRYIKTIWHGETGEVLRHTDKPLTEHRKPKSVKRAVGMSVSPPKADLVSPAPDVRNGPQADNP
jgi:hypothetical protein